MAKGKFGFSKLRSKKEKPVTSLEWPDTDDEHHPGYSNEFITRPPPLDHKTEIELRQACAIVLQDLKPSGYDIEDTRMKSDILVDDHVRDPAHRTVASKPAQRNKLQRPQDDASKRDSRLMALPPMDLNKFNEYRAFSANGFDAKPSLPQRNYDRTSSLTSQARTHSMTSQARTQSLTTAVLAPMNIESPLAPLPSAATDTRHELPSPIRPNVNRSTNGDAESVSTSYRSNSANHTASVSTGLTSAQITPLSGSQRASDAATYSKTNDSGAGEWMKHEVEKRIKSQDATKTTAPADAKVNGDDEKQSPKRSKGFFSNFRARSKSKASTEKPEHIVANGTAASGIEIKHPIPDLPDRAVDRSVQAPPPVGTNFSRPSSSRGISRESGFQRDASQPTLPKLDTAVGLTGAAPPTLIAASASRRDSDRLSSLKDKSDEPLSNARARSLNNNTSRPTSNVSHADPNSAFIRQPSDRQTGKAVASPIGKKDPAQHKQDSSIFVKDFYKPQLQSADSTGRSPNAPNSGTPRTESAGPRPADMSTLLQAMDARGTTSSSRITSDRSYYTAAGSIASPTERPGTSDSASSRRTLPQNRIPPRASSRSQSMLQPPANIDHFARNKAQDRSFSMNAMTTKQPLTSLSIQTGHLTNGVHPADDSDNISLRNSNGPTSLYNAKIYGAAGRPKSRGLGKFFSRLGGGGDSYSRKKMYLNPHDYYHAYGLQTPVQQEEEEVDEDWDEEACAAPVIGFGRGW